MLQSIAQTLGVHVDRTPKCHCELVGEGIKYAWACSKNKYQSLLLEKKGKGEFYEMCQNVHLEGYIKKRECSKICEKSKEIHNGLSCVASNATQ